MVNLGAFINAIEKESTRTFGKHGNHSARMPRRREGGLYFVVITPI